MAFPVRADFCFGSTCVLVTRSFPQNLTRPLCSYIEAHFRAPKTMDTHTHTECVREREGGKEPHTAPKCNRKLFWQLKTTDEQAGKCEPKDDGE